MSRIDLFKRALAEKRAVKVIAGIDNFDIEKVKPLQEKAMKAQQELITLSQAIYAKIEGANSAAAQGAETAAPSAEAANTETAPVEAAQ